MPGIKDFVLKSAAKYEAVDGLQPVTAAIRRAMDACATFESEGRKISNDKNLSPQGKREKLEAFLKTHSHEIIRARRSAEIAATRLSERRAKFKLMQVDPSDAASAALRSEIRASISRMSKGERQAFLLSADPLYWTAVLEAPNALTGIDTATREAVQSLAIEKAFPGQLAKIEHDNEAIQFLKMASQVLNETVCEVANFPNVTVLNRFVESSVPDQQHIEADVNRATEPLANASVEAPVVKSPKPNADVTALVPEKTPEELQAEVMAWANQEVAAMRARGEF